MTREEAVIEAVQSWLSGMLASAIDGDTDPPKPSR